VKWGRLEDPVLGEKGLRATKRKKRGYDILPRVVKLKFYLWV